MAVSSGLKHYRNWAVSGFVGLVFFIITPLALAGYQIDPVRVEVNIPEGKKVGMASVKLTSTETSPIRLRVSLTDWTVDENGGLHLSETALPGSLMDRIRLNPKEFEVPPNGRQIIRLAVSLPENAVKGEYRSMIMLEELKTATQHLALAQGKNASIDIKKRIGLALYVYYANPKPDPQVVQFAVQPELKPTPSGNAAPSPENEKIKKETIVADEALPPTAEPGLKAGVTASPKAGWKIHLDLENRGDRHSQLTGSVLVMRSNPASVQPNLSPKNNKGSKNGAVAKETVVAELSPKSLGNIFILPNQHFLNDFLLATEEEVRQYGPGQYRLKLNLVQHNPESETPIKAETVINVGETDKPSEVK